MLTDLSQAFINWLGRNNPILNTCPLCMEPSTELICISCKAMLPAINNQCFQCGLPLHKVDTTDHALRCGQCLKSPPAFDLCVSPFHYALPINQFITQLKFRHQLHYARILADLLIEKIDQHSENLPECIIPVPLHSNRLRQRGFNQAIEIARSIAKRYDIELDTHSCSRIVSTAPQMEQNKSARQTNIRNAFKVSADFNYKDVAIVDDVMTTGHTLNEISRALRKQGTKRIQVWAVARS